MADILMVEDEPDVARLISEGLGEFGHHVDQAERADIGLRLASRRGYDLLIVDRMLPDLDGLTLIRSLRERRPDIPVLILSGLGGVNDRVEGLNSGADDYLPKPFAFSELVARINALLRRPAQSGERLRVGDLEMNLIRRKVSRGGRSIQLLPREFELLEFMMRHSDRLITRTMLLEGVWGYHFDPKTNIVETHISRLRAKLGADMIITVRNGGYVLHASEH